MQALSFTFDSDFFCYTAEIENTINNGNSTMALEKLKLIDIEDERGKRYIAHLYSKIKLSDGKYSEGIKIINESQSLHGEYIGMLADKATMLYMSGDYLRWKKCVDLFEDKLKSVKRNLSNQSLVNNYVLLAKFKEELGEVTKALAIYKQLESTIDHLDDDYAMVLAQLVRLKAEWSSNTDLTKLYGELFNLNKNLHHKSYQIEVTHSLFIAELYIFGEEAAWPRFEEIKKELDEYDYSLFIVDYISYCMKQEKKVQNKLFKLLDMNDMFVKSLYNINNGMTVDVSLLSHSLTVHSYLTLMALLVKKSSEKGSIHRLFLLLTSNFSSGDSKLWHSLISEKISPTENLVFSKSQKVLSLDDKEISLSRKKNIYEILCLFSSEARSISLEQVVTELWDVEYNESYYHRLRVAIKRFNKEVCTAFVGKEIFSITAKEISLIRNLDFSDK